MLHVPAIVIIGFTALLAELASAQATASTTASVPLGVSRSPVRLIELRGDAYQRGVQHGKALKKEIDELLVRWEASLQQDFELSRAGFVSRFLAKTDYLAAVKAALPDLLDEVRGIADGAVVDFNTIFVWQLVDEIWAMGGAVVREKCTAIGVDRRDPQPTIVAQNLDIPQWYHGFQTVLDIDDATRGVRAFVVTIPGVIGCAGISNRRVAIACNTLLQLAPCRDGLPVAFIVRGVLAQRDHEQALAFLHRSKHASGQNYTIGGPEIAPAYECSAGKIARCEVYPGAPFTFHTNNALVNDDFAAAWHERSRQQSFDPLVGPRPCPRLVELQHTWDATSKPDLDAVVAALASRGSKPSICNDSTFACIVMLLGEEPELRICPGPPDRARLETLRFGR